MISSSINPKEDISKIVRVLPLPELRNKISIGPIYTLFIDRSNIYLGLESSIQVRDLKTLRLLKNLKALDDIVLYVFVDNEYIYAGTRDNYVMIWSKNSFELVNTISEHQDSVTSVIADENYLFTGSNDGSIIIWKKGSWSKIGVIRKNFDFLLDMLIDEGKLYVAADTTIYIIRINDFRTITELKGHKDDITCLACDGSYLYSYSDDVTLRIWDKSSLKQTHIIYVNDTYANSLSVDENYIYTTGDNNKLYVWEKNSLSKIFEFTAHDNDISKIVSKDKYLYSVSTDGTLKIWPKFIWSENEEEMEAFLVNVFENGRNLKITNFEEYNTAVWIFNLCKLCYEKKNVIGEKARTCIENLVPQQINFLEDYVLLDLIYKNKLEVLKEFFNNFKYNFG